MTDPSSSPSRQIPVAGHGATITSATIGDKALIGIGAVVSEGALVEAGAQLAAGSVVPPGRRIPAGEVRPYVFCIVTARVCVTATGLAAPWALRLPPAC